jgi:nucleoside-diphosphate-sugar epimerase
MKVLISNIAGFVGSYLAEEVLKKRGVRQLAGAAEANLPHSKVFLSGGA